MNQNEPIFFTPPSGRMQNRRLYKGGGGEQTSSTVNSVPEELKPLASLYTKQATNIAQTPFQTYTGQRNADLNATQNAGIGMVQSRALNGSPTMNNAENSLNQFIQGGQTNPYLDSMVSRAQGSVVDQFNNMVKPQTETAMRNSGSFGNSGLDQRLALQQKAAGVELGNIATQMYGNAYGQDQQNRLSAINQAPTFGNAKYADAGQLISAGNIMQNQDQQNKDFGYNQFQAAQDHPYKQLQATGSVLQGNLGTKTTSSGGGGK